MSSVAIGKYLGCMVVFVLVIYITTQVMKPNHMFKEGLTSGTGVTSLENYLKKLKNESGVLKTKVDLNTSGAKQIWQDILVQIEDNINLKTLESIALIPQNLHGVPKFDSDQMKTILAYNQYKSGLKNLDDFLDGF